MKTLLNYNYAIGTGDDKYPAGTSLTDSIVGIAPIASIQNGAQSYNKGFVINGRTIHYGDLFVSEAGDVITIHFQQPLYISCVTY